MYKPKSELGSQLANQMNLPLNHEPMKVANCIPNPTHAPSTETIAVVGNYGSCAIVFFNI